MRDADEVGAEIAGDALGPPERVGGQQLDRDVSPEDRQARRDAFDQLAAVGERPVDVEQQVGQVQRLAAGDLDVERHRTTITGQWAW
jgi:hypothetical protein